MHLKQKDNLNFIRLIKYSGQKEAEVYLYFIWKEGSYNKCYTVLRKGNQRNLLANKRNMHIKTVLLVYIQEKKWRSKI